MKEIEMNKKAWGLLSEDHYHHFKKCLESGNYELNPIIEKEIGDISGKKVIHLQCNTGADSIMLAKKGAIVTGVDLVPGNIHYAKKLAEDFKMNSMNFIESDIMTLSEIHDEKYDMVFTSEGAIGWLPDLKKWGRTIRKLLKDDGFFYVYDAHPFYMAMDEDKFIKHILEIKYPYFGKIPDEDNIIGGYASEGKEAPNYFWMYTISDIINSLSSAGLHIEFFNEFDYADCGFVGLSGEERDSCYNFSRGKFPMGFSLKATVYKD